MRGPCEPARDGGSDERRQTALAPNAWYVARLAEWIEGWRMDGRTDGRGDWLGWLWSVRHKNMYATDNVSERVYVITQQSHFTRLPLLPSSPFRFTVSRSEPIDSPLFRSFNSRSSTANITSHPSLRLRLGPSVRSSFCLESPRASSSLSIGRVLPLCYGRRRHEGGRERTNCLHAQSLPLRRRRRLLRGRDCQR